jgi:cell division protein FtsL
LYAVRRPVENVYLVRERDRKRTKELLALAFAALPPMAVLFAAIWANLEAVRLGYQLERLESQVELLVRRNRNLQSDRAQAAALSRVESIARTSLELAPPRLAQVIQVRDGAFADVPPPVPAAALDSDLPELYGPPKPVSTEEGF